MTGGNAGQLSFPWNTQRVRTDKQKSERPEKRKNEKGAVAKKAMAPLRSGRVSGTGKERIFGGFRDL